MTKLCDFARKHCQRQGFNSANSFFQNNLIVVCSEKNIQEFYKDFISVWMEFS